MHQNPKGYPESICLRLTRRCNAGCSFCQSPNISRIELSLRQIQGIACRLSGHVRSIKLSGGEPTVRNDLPEIVRAISFAGLHTVITTNGIRIRPEVFDAATDCGAEFKFSVHRPDRSNDEVLRVRSFENVLANMAICADRRVRFSINSVITSESIHLMSAMVDFALTCGARKISFIPVIPRGRASGTEGLLYSTELQCIRERTAELALQHHDNIIVRCIDIRQRDYWVIENDGTIWIEREAEQLDRRIGDLADLLGTDCKP